MIQQQLNCRLAFLYLSTKKISQLFSSTGCSKLFYRPFEDNHRNNDRGNNRGNRYSFGPITGSLALSFGLFSKDRSEDTSKDCEKQEDNRYHFMAETITPTDQLLPEKSGSSMRSKFELFIMQFQSEFCKQLEQLELKYSDEVDPDSVKSFQVDRWVREEGGGGVSCVIQDGSCFEKAGVNISVVNGSLPPAAAQQMRSRGKVLPENVPLRFFAAGISSVIHPRNPNIPTMHFNFRYFEVEVEDNNQANNQKVPGAAESKVYWWFGGGTDLTPYILDEDDARFFHTHLKQACDRHNPTYYQQFKKWCDDYFFIKHRNERRGVGGIFFDDIDQPNQQDAFLFVKDCANAIGPAYLPICERNASKGYSYADRQWQLLRRGRYVEFNLIYDRGTKFGLMTPGARYESILMSLPLTARWEYQHQPEPGTKESRLLEVLRNPREWV